jgi:hypothetical protein
LDIWGTLKKNMGAPTICLSTVQYDHY